MKENGIKISLMEANTKSIQLQQDPEEA